MTTVNAILVLCALVTASGTVASAFFLWLIVKITAKQDQELANLNRRPGTPRK